MTAVRKRLKKLRFLPVYPLVAWLLLAAHTTERQLHIGIGLAGLGLALRVWAHGYIGDLKVNSRRVAGSRTRIGRMVTAGPYAFIRHPLYAGSALIGAGIIVVAGGAWAGLALAAFFVTVYPAKAAQEEALLREEIGAPYLRYQASVPRWLPVWRRYERSQGCWRWNAFAASKEWKTCIWVALVLVALYFREEMIQERGWLAFEWEWKHWLLISLSAAAVAFDAAFELRKARTSGPVSGRLASA